MGAEKILNVIIILFLLVGINVSGVSQADTAYVNKTIKTFPWLDFPIVHSNDIKGSLHQLKRINDIENIPLNLLNKGFLVNLTDAYDNGTNVYLTYQYIGDGTTNEFENDWIEVMLINTWRPNTFIEEGRLVLYNDEYYVCQTSHTSNPSFDSAEESNFSKLFPQILDGDWKINGDDLYSIPDSTISIVNQKVGIGIKKDLNYELNLKGSIWADNSSKSIIIGDSAGFALNQSYGLYNVLIGSKAGKSSTAWQNIAIGVNTLLSTMNPGPQNLAIGSSVLTNSTTAGHNIAIGNYNLNGSMEDFLGDGNIAIGNNILEDNIGQYNIGIGNDMFTDNITGKFNIGMGKDILNSNTTGNDNIVMGSNALVQNTTGVKNVAIGSTVLTNSTTASGNIAIGNYNLQKGIMLTTFGDNNVAIGDSILSNNLGKHNIGIGWSGLKSNTTGESQVAIGTHVLTNNITGTKNVAIGYQNLNNGNMLFSLADVNVAIGNNILSANIGRNNVGIGTMSLTANTTGRNNIAIGMNALKDNTTGQFNVAIGSSVLTKNTTKSYNIAIGKSNLNDAITGSFNMAIGNNILSVNTGVNNLGIGANVLKANTSGGSNIGIGFNLLELNTTSSSNIALGQRVLSSSNPVNPNVGIGNQALYSNTGGGNNIAIGFHAFYANTISSDAVAIGNYSLSKYAGVNSRSVAIGQFSLRNVTSGGQNTAVGFQSLQGLGGSTNNYNTAVGSFSLYLLTTGSLNIGIGRVSGAFTGVGQNNLSSSGSIYLGAESRTKSSGRNNEIVIGYGAVGIGNDSIRIGNANIIWNGGEVNFSATSDIRLKKNIESLDLGLDFILKLQPVSYIRKNNPDEEIEFGFIAQDLRETLIQSGYKNSGMVSGKETETTFLSLRHSDLYAPLVRSAQELKFKLNAEKEKGEKLNQKLDNLIKRLEKLEQRE